VVYVATIAYYLSLRLLYFEADRRVASTTHDSMNAFLLSLVLGCNIKLYHRFQWHNNYIKFDQNLSSFSRVETQ